MPRWLDRVMPHLQVERHPVVVAADVVDDREPELV